jgi:hypothetical protein
MRQMTNQPRVARTYHPVSISYIYKYRPNVSRIVEFASWMCIWATRKAGVDCQELETRLASRIMTMGERKP